MFLAGCRQNLLSKSSGGGSTQSDNSTTNDVEQQKEPRKVDCFFFFLDKLPAELISFILIDQFCGSDQNQPQPGRGDPNICRLVCKQWYQLLKDEIRPAPTFTCNQAARNGDLELLKWARKQGAPWESRTADHATMSGNLELLKYLKSNQCPMSNSLSTYAAMAPTNRIAMLDWLKSQDSVRWLDDAAAEAAELGHQDALMWIKDQGQSFESSHCCARAARGGQLELVKWLHKELKAPIDSRMTWQAAEGGHRHVLEWALEKQVPFHELTLSYAAQSGDLDLLKWVKSVAPELNFSRKILDYAVQGGNLDMLNWLVEENSGIRVNEGVCNIAAQSGNLKVLQWAVSKLEEDDDDLDNDTKAACNAAFNGHVHILDWLQKRKQNSGGKNRRIKKPTIILKSPDGSKSAKSPPSCFPVEVGCRAAQAGRIKTLKWLKANDACSFDESTCAAAALGGHVQVLRWLKEEAGCPWDGSAFSSAEKNNHKHAMKWLIANGAPQEQKVHLNSCDKEKKVAKIEEGYSFEVLGVSHKHGSDVGTWTIKIKTPQGEEEVYGHFRSRDPREWREGKGGLKYCIIDCDGSSCLTIAYQLP